MTISIQAEKANVRQRFPRLTLLTATCCLFTLLIAATPSLAGERQFLMGHVPHAVASSLVLNQLSGATRLNLAIGLPLRNQSELDGLLVQLSDPDSPNFRHYLGAEQFAAEFGPAEQDYQALIAFAHENGLVVTGTHSNRVLLDVSGDVSDIERVFHVKMLVYRHPVRGDFYAPDSEPSIDLDTKVLSVSGLDNFAVPQPMNLKEVAVNEASYRMCPGSGPGGYFIGNDFRAAYAPGVTLTGSGQTVGLLEFDGFYRRRRAEKRRTGGAAGRAYADGAARWIQRDARKRQYRGDPGHHDGLLYGARTLEGDGLRGEKCERHPEPYGDRQSGEAAQLLLGFRH